MNNAKFAKIFLKMARYDCMMLSILKIAKVILTFAVVANSLISGVYIISAMKK